MVGNVPFPFRKYIDELITILPYWRTPEGAALSDELFELIETVAPDGADDLVDISDDLKNALQAQMGLQNPTYQVPPALARVSIKYVNVLFKAERKEIKRT